MRWKKIDSSIVYINPWFQIRKDRVIRPDGKKGTYDVVETHGPSVFVVMMDEKNRVGLIRLFRYPLGRQSLEIPGGNSEGENLLKAAKRELMEETGYEARKWIRAGNWQPMNGVSSETAHVFIARGLKRIDKNAGREEGITEIIFVPFPKTIQMIQSGKITDGQTVGGLFFAGLKLGFF